MRAGVIVLLMGLMLSFGAHSAQAQRRMPAEGAWAIGGSIDAAGPSDASLLDGPALTGNIEGYLTPRVSIRGQLSGTWWDITGRNFSGTVKPVIFDGNLVYNWEHGIWHPYATAGIGMYRFRSAESGTLAVTDTKGGFNAGGGIEYFFRRRATLTGEVLYHKVDSFNTPLTTFNDGSFWTVAAGVKRYF
jgi:hypothetical protein